MKSSKELSHSPTLWGHFLPPPTLKFSQRKNCNIHWLSQNKEKEKGKKLRHPFGKAKSQFREANISGNDNLERQQYLRVAFYQTNELKLNTMGKATCNVAAVILCVFFFLSRLCKFTVRELLYIFIFIFILRVH